MISYSRLVWVGIDGNNFIPSGRSISEGFIRVWEMPDDFDHEAGRMLVMEASRPCGGSTIDYFLALSRTKKLQDIDASNAKKYLLTYIRDLSEYCELAVLSALDDIRLNDPNPFFPTIAEIRAIAAKYHEKILIAQSYLKEYRCQKQ